MDTDWPGGYHKVLSEIFKFLIPERIVKRILSHLTVIQIPGFENDESSYNYIVTEYD